ncbi:MAG: Gfo/Idh/MocA family oxidoreductase [Planctomycetaceae bacterium]|nr:Gfo/Idh/MocA family oxidoreductase [Planctomycetaceae bacterium]
MFPTQTRRRFLTTTAAGAFLAPTIITSAVRGDDAPSAKLTVGFIGVGKMGRGHLTRFVGYDDIEVVAVCDVVQERLDDAQRIVNERYANRNKGGDRKQCAAYKDFRELLARDDIDAVLIATPDHWHAIPCILAAKAGKDVYCEKPLTHNIVEGRKLVEAVAEHGIIFQTGSQQRSEFGGKFRVAADLIRNGRIGQVLSVNIGVGAPAVECDLAAQETPSGTDWNMWLGPAPERPYNEILCPKGIHNHFPAWRNYQEYAGGGLADMGAHHFDIAQWALGMDDSGPVCIEAPAEGQTTGARFTYANGMTMIHGGPGGCTFVGTKGILYVDRGRIMSEPGSILDEPLPEDAPRVYFSENHHRNWLDCIRSREQPICTAEIGHRSASVCHLGNLAYRLQRTLHWDPAREEFANDDEANALRWREPRGEWNVI